MQIPFLDLKSQYAHLKDEIDAAIQQVLDGTAFAGGPFVARFEEDFARFCNCKYAVGLGSGTEALWLALIALGIGPGDEVISVPNTFIATAEAITYAGATPVFVDVDEQTYNLNPGLFEQAITSKTKAVIPVHLFGQMSDMDPIVGIARRNGLAVIEDASQAHGAEYKGRRAGSIGDVGCFSFYPGKNLGAYGEAGAVVTNNEELKTKIQTLRDHGQTKKYIHSLIGWNARMDGIQGAILQVKLKYLVDGNAARRKHARLYTELFENTDELVTPKEPEHRLHVYHIYAIRVKKRNWLLQALGEKGITCGIHYPKPLHLQEAYQFLGLGRGAFPVAERCAEEFLSLPIYPELTAEQIGRVASEVNTLLETSTEIYARVG